MEPVPLTLDVHRLSPYNLIPSSADGNPHSQNVPTASEASSVPPPPPFFSLSPTPNYPSPFGTMSLGETFSVLLNLSNTSGNNQPVSGVRMMAEIQSPSSRYRLGEVVHGENEEGQVKSEGLDVGDEDVTLPEEEKLAMLGHGDAVELDVRTEMKEMGLHILICSVAWETVDGRRTFQRFFKFNVNAPLNIKTRPFISASPNAILSPTERQNIYLEVLTQNVSQDGMLFDKVTLEPVQGLISRSIGIDELPAESEEAEAGPSKRKRFHVFDGSLATLLPLDTRQYLFVLSPDPSAHSSVDKSDIKRSVFPPTYSPGSVLPLGRLDVSWFSGPYREKGRLQTSTLNRRIPAVPSLTRTPSSIPPSRTASAHPPSPGGPPRIGSPRPPPLPSKEKGGGWEYDLVVLDLDRGGVVTEEEFNLKLRIAVRSPVILPSDESPQPPPPLSLAVQYLSPVPTAALGVEQGLPPFTVTSPSRPSTPLSLTSGNSARPMINGSLPASRPLSPISSPMRQSISSTSHPSSPFNTFSSIPLTPTSSQPIQDTEIQTSFPPPPNLTSSIDASGSTGTIEHIGSSFLALPKKDFELVYEDLGTTYQEEGEADLRKRWETNWEYEWSFIGLDPGLARLGGVRVLLLTDMVKGTVGAEWSALGWASVMK